MSDLPYQHSLVIIPTYNEILNIEKMILKVHELYPELHILIVDDNSPDGTANVVKNLMQTKSNLFLLERKLKDGLGRAYIAGFKYALERDYQFIFEMDCDFSHSPNDIKILLKAAQTNDLVIGSRYINGIRIINWPMHRLILSYFAGVYTRIITGLNVLDATGGFKCFRRETLSQLNLDEIFSNGYSFQIELNYRVYSKKLKIQEVPIVFTERRDGESKMSFNIVIEAVFAVIKLRLKRMLGQL